ncbi:hypothetical protein LCI23_05145 [Massilia sp. MS-15]|nr:hypothetical protein [Massilia sp. MS-15]
MKTLLTIRDALRPMHTVPVEYAKFRRVSLWRHAGWDMHRPEQAPARGYSLYFQPSPTFEARHSGQEG